MMIPKKSTYDVAIIGGGIAGVAVARDAALRGLSVILFEKSEIGSGASSKSSKLIHGGIRYLELAWLDLRQGRLFSAFKNFNFVLSSLKEAKILAAIAPTLVHPIRLCVPIYKNQHRGIFAVFLGTVLYGWLSKLFGNSAAPLFLPGHEKALKTLPLLRSEKLIGAIEISDHTTDDLSLVRAVAHSAVTAGAEIFEQSDVMEWQSERQNYRLKIRLSNQEQFVSARSIVNATGAWIDQIRKKSHTFRDRYVFPVGGSHIEVPAFLGKSAILEASDGRVFFVVEKNGRARIGTTEWPCENPDIPLSAPEEDIDYLLASLSSYFPSKKWTRADVLSSDAGLRPLATQKPFDSATRLSREHVIHLDQQGIFHLVGVKLTDHRRAAEETLDQIMKKLRQKNPGSKTAITPLDGHPPK